MYFRGTPALAIGHGLVGQRYVAIRRLFSTTQDEDELRTSEQRSDERDDQALDRDLRVTGYGAPKRDISSFLPSPGRRLQRAIAKYPPSPPARPLTGPAPDGGVGGLDGLRSGRWSPPCTPWGKPGMAVAPGADRGCAAPTS